MSSIPSVSEYLTEAKIHAGLNTAWVGGKIYSFGSLKSTNVFAFRLAEEGAEQGTVVLADEQTAGRGRFGRRWYSPPGLGLWCSIILRPALFPWEAPKMTMVAALAAARAIDTETGLTASLKWPNDVLIGGRKVCGILTELNTEGNAVNYVIVGIGLNVNHREGDFPVALRSVATSVRIEGDRPLSRLSLFQALLRELEAAYECMMQCGFSALRGDIQSRSCLVGKTVGIRLKNRIYRGEAIDIDEDGALVLKVGGDRIERLISGEVQLVEDRIS